MNMQKLLSRVFQDFCVKNTVLQGLPSLTAALEPGAAKVEPGGAPVEPEAALLEYGAAQVEPGKAQVSKKSIASDSGATGPLSGSSGLCQAPISNRALAQFIVTLQFEL